MARRSLSDQRHLLVELELDGSVLGDAHSPQRFAAVSARPTARPQSASARRSDPSRLTSPYKLKQKVLSSRSRDTLSSEEPSRRHTTSAPRRSSSTPQPSPLTLIADAVRQNVTQRTRVLLEAQDELRQLPRPTGGVLLSTKVVQLLNRVRSLTLSIIEMVRYFHQQLSAAKSSGDEAVWAFKYEFQELFLRLCTSDTDCFMSSPSFVRFFEAMSVSAVRNPLLDGISLDSSELLLCSCQASTNTSLFQLLVSRLEAFAVQVRRDYPAWQVLPHKRVARALLDLVEVENRANATRMLPSYLRPEGSARTSARRDEPLHHTPPLSARSVSAMYQDDFYDDEGAQVDHNKHQKVQSIAVAWGEVAVPTLQLEVARPSSGWSPPTGSLVKEVTPKGQLSVSPRESVTASRAVDSTPEPQPRPAAATRPRELPSVAEPKVVDEPLAERQPAKKTKKPQTQAVSRSVPPFAHAAHTENTPYQVAVDLKTADQEQVEATIAMALDKLPQFSAPISEETLPVASTWTENYEQEVQEQLRAQAPEQPQTPLVECGDPIFLQQVHSKTSTPRRHDTIASALDKLPRFSFATPVATPRAASPEVEADVLTTTALPREEQPTPQLQVDREPPSQSLSQVQTPLQHSKTPTPRADACDPAPQPPPTPSEPPSESVVVAHMEEPESELSRILSLCRDVQVAAIDLSQMLDTTSFALPTPVNDSIYRPTSPLAPLSSASRFALSARYLERELKMLRRYYRVWETAVKQTRERKRRLRVACAARRVGRFGRLVLRKIETRRRDSAARRIQRQWHVHDLRKSAKAFHTMHKSFKRLRFFTRLMQRVRRRNEASRVIQDGWRKALKRTKEEEQRREEEARTRERRAHAARQLQAFAKEQMLRKKLAEALENNRRTLMKEQIKATKARQDETKRRQLEAKRLAELSATMQTALKEMDAKWRDVDAEKEKLRAEQEARDAMAKAASEERTRELAQERIDRFLERSVLRRRLQTATQANEAIAQAKRELEFVRERLEKRQREQHAQRLLVERMLWWKVEKTAETERRAGERQLQKAEKAHRKEARAMGRELKATVVKAVAESKGNAYCGVAQWNAVEATYHTRLTAKHEEAQQIRRQAAREKIATFVLHWLMQREIDTATQQVEQMKKQYEEAEMRAEAEKEREAKRREQLRREEQQRLVHVWLAEQVKRRREQRRAEAARRQAEEEAKHEALRRLHAEREALRMKEEQQAQSRRREQLMQLQRRKLQMKSQQIVAKYKREAMAERATHALSDVEADKQHERQLETIKKEMEARREHEREHERLIRARMVEIVMDTQRVAERTVAQAITVALTTYETEVESIRVWTAVQNLRLRFIQRKACYRWRQFVLSRQTMAAIARAACWLQEAQTTASIVAEAEANAPVALTDDARRELRLLELRCIASARKVQRCWRSWCVRIRKKRRTEAKAEEDDLIAHAKGLTELPQRQQAEEEALRRITQWLRRLCRNRQSQYRVQMPVQGHCVVFFTGGRVWIASSVAEMTMRLRFDRGVTRKLLQATDPLIHSPADVSHLLTELLADVLPILSNAKCSPRSTLNPSGTLVVGDVDEMELPRFCLVTKQLSKTRSMVKRTQLLDAKTLPSPTASSPVLTIFDAVESASVDDAQFLLLQGADLHAVEPCHQRSALHMLAFSFESTAQRVAMLRFLVEKAKLNVRARDASDETPLMVFAAHGCLGLVETLLAMQPELWLEADNDGRNAFHRACERDQPEIAVLLQRHVMKHAAGHAEQRLLELYGAKTLSAMHILASRGHIECIKQLLGALESRDLREKLANLRDLHGRSPLHLAVLKSHVDTTRQLMLCGANRAATDDWQISVLHYATKASEAVEMLSTLLDGDAGGVNLQAVDVRGDTALHWAAAAGRPAVVRHLLVLGADPNALDRDWESPAHVAAARGFEDCARLLLPTGEVADAMLQELASAKSYYHPSSPSAAAQDRAKRAEYDWEDLHQEVELVEESGRFSSEDEGDEDGDAAWD